VELPPLNRPFITHFGEMGSRWGINRTVGQIYALLSLAPPRSTMRSSACARCTA
jgi:DNA-binding transcriptional regulator GbsR (MarR family)